MGEVYCDGCHEWHDAEAVEFVDVAEDAQGRDVISFRCPKAGDRVGLARVAPAEIAEAIEVDARIDAELCGEAAADRDAIRERAEARRQKIYDSFGG